MIVSAFPCYRKIWAVASVCTRRLRSVLTRNYDADKPFEIESAALSTLTTHRSQCSLGAMKVPAMSKAPDLQIEVQDPS